MSRVAMKLAVVGVACSVILLIAAFILPWRVLNSATVTLILKTELAISAAALLIALLSVPLQRDNHSLQAVLYSLLYLTITASAAVVTAFWITARHPV